MQALHKFVTAQGRESRDSAKAIIDRALIIIQSKIKVAGQCKRFGRKIADAHLYEYAYYNEIMGKNMN